MKKVLCAILALVLSLTTCALATGVPSKTTSDMTQFEVVDQNGNVATFKPETAPEKVAAAETELKKLIAAEKVENYFAGAKDADGKAVDLAAVLGLKDGEELTVNAFTAVYANGFAAGCGDINVVLNFPAVYAAGQKVLVLLGVENDAKVIEWTVLEGVGVASAKADMGAIQAVIPEKLMLAVQGCNALLAVVSK